MFLLMLLDPQNLCYHLTTTDLTTAAASTFKVHPDVNGSTKPLLSPDYYTNDPAAAATTPSTFKVHLDYIIICDAKFYNTQLNFMVEVCTSQSTTASSFADDTRVKRPIKDPLTDCQDV